MNLLGLLENSDQWTPWIAVPFSCALISLLLYGIPNSLVFCQVHFSYLPTSLRQIAKFTLICLDFKFESKFRDF
jgi:hypothetical protein